ncbi:hypothetical protein ACT691_13960 [Vibrio metschnikovii]
MLKSKPTYSKIFGDFLCDMAAQDPKLMAITPAMREGSGMVRFSKEYPSQYFDVAIAEQTCRHPRNRNGNQRLSPDCGDLLNLFTARL